MESCLHIGDKNRLYAQSDSAEAAPGMKSDVYDFLLCVILLTNLVVQTKQSVGCVICLDDNFERNYIHL